MSGEKRALHEQDTPPLQGRIRSQPEDFRVDELPATAPEGEGEHLWLRVRKTGLNTEQVASMLARAAGVGRRAVGYAGLKDRHAVTTQWFSLHLPGMADPDWGDHLPPQVEVLEAARHRRKLQTGHLAGNRFHLRVRACDGDREAAEARLAAMARGGVPNFFGPQRFGRDGDNPAKAAALFQGQLRVRDRKLRGLYLSAARALLFNDLLRRRVADGTWDRALIGDALQLDGRGSFFVHQGEDPTVDARVADLDLHATGPLWGRGTSPVEGAVAALESEVAAQHPVLARGLEEAGLRQERRPLRLRVEGLAWDWPREDILELAFTLGPGGYATTVLARVMRLEEGE
ncbi:tRNA pseudouridine(13) synthase TruD [Ectothiorhodospira mobilis]|uniref:tRNA pseudouridine(13) synthase TruD n=1 Tax=Ectothiorhodospira mobilis TaxID=195064 RepID=UPI001EE96ABC|nr:tRNA pseudouridine(13) synthase TruD [Ectothiorhodospira mobilis]MCG5536096.1 tRNA pseudouridine(13) synthase TruD [Ectothiorhodospira mobilis]